MTRSTFDPQQRYGVPAENWRYRLRYLGETAFDRLLHYGLKPLPLDWGAALVGEAARWLLPFSPGARRVEKHLAIGTLADYSLNTVNSTAFSVKSNAAAKSRDWSISQR